MFPCNHYTFDIKGHLCVCNPNPNKCGGSDTSLSEILKLLMWGKNCFTALSAPKLYDLMCFTGLLLAHSNVFSLSVM